MQKKEKVFNAKIYLVTLLHLNFLSIFLSISHTLCFFSFPISPFFNVDLSRSVYLWSSLSLCLCLYLSALQLFFSLPRPPSVVYSYSLDVFINTVSFSLSFALSLWCQSDYQSPDLSIFQYLSLSLLLSLSLSLFFFLNPSPSLSLFFSISVCPAVCFPLLAYFSLSVPL